MKVGDLVLIKLTGEIGMILEVIEATFTEGYRKGYKVRVSSYEVVKFFEFELTERGKEK